jgi:putative hydrolase of the HAD superfamily
MPIKAIFLDAAGTLIKTARPVGESYAAVAEKYGLSVSSDEITERFRACFSSAPPLAFPGAPAENLEKLELAWWKEVVRKIFEPWEPFDRFDEYFSELFTYFSAAEAWSLYPEVASVLSDLRERRLVLEVVSNFDYRLFGILAGLGIASCFDSIVISSRVGCAKPAPEIFHAAMRLHRLEAAEALHVGDSLDKDANGAAGAGLRGVLLDRNGKAASDFLPCIRTLSELLPIIRT